jgi:hypothetical protein
MGVGAHITAIPNRRRSLSLLATGVRCNSAPGAVGGHSFAAGQGGANNADAGVVSRPFATRTTLTPEIDVSKPAEEVPEASGCAC